MAKLRAPWSTPRKKPKKWAPRLSRGFSPDLLQGINTAVVKAAEGLEQAIIRAVSRESTRPKVNRGGFLSRLRSIVGFGLGDVSKQAFRMGVDAEAVGKATARKHMEAKTPAKVDKWGGRKPPAPKAPRNVNLGVTIRTPATLRDSFKDLAPTLIGSGSELFDEVVEAIAANPPESEAGRRRVAQGVLDKFGKRGITGFVDKAGRRWNIVSYVEMATRTAAGNLAMSAHLAELQAAGFDVVRVTVMPNCHPYCQPFQGRLLSITGRTLRYNGEPVVTSIADAISRGFRHPNAVLGGAQVADLGVGGAVAGSKGAYSGPSVTIFTAKGNSTTVSPEHPVFTGRGWVTAKSVTTSDYVFSTVESKGATVRGPVKTDVNDVVTTIEQEFSALKVVGASTTAPTAGLNFDDDRQFLQGEVDIVMTDGALLDVPDAKVIKETGEILFVRANSDSVFTPGGDASLNGEFAIFGSVFGSLSNGDVVSLKPPSNGVFGYSEQWAEFLAGHSGLIEVNDFSVISDSSIGPKFDAVSFERGVNARFGDSKDPGTVTNCFATGIEPDKVVNVVFGQFTGQAYDFQTVSGAYAANGIVLHNCRHTIKVDLPGQSIPDPDLIDPGDYEASQELRRFEREVRAGKRKLAAAVTPEAQAKARREIRDAQARIRAHVAETGVPRNRYREQVGVAL